MRNENDENKRGGGKYRGKQGRKDSPDPRVNFDNERLSKFKKDGKCHASNDIGWYSRNAEMLRSATQISSYDTAGSPVPVKLVDSVPGVCALYWNPNLGGGLNEPLNQAANSTYSFVVHANSRNYAYDPADQMCMIIAGMNAFAFIAMGLRAYGVMNNFNALDMYTPSALVTAMGFNYTDLRNNLPNMWFDLNEMVNAMTQVWIPNTMPLIERWYWMNTYIYKDAESAKAQYYLFVQNRFLQFSAKTSTTGSALMPVDWFTPDTPGIITYNTWADYKEMFWHLLNSMLQNEDRGIIFGDILKAYGAEKIYAMNTVSSDYKVTPIYEPEVLMQIENATVTAMIPTSVTQSSDGRLEQHYTEATPQAIATNVTALPGYKLLNFHTKSGPSDADIMIATRLSAAGTFFGAASSETMVVVGPETAGTEVVKAIRLYGYTWSQGVPTLVNFGFNGKTMSPASANPHAQQLQILSMWSAFDWAPWIIANDSFDASAVVAGTNFDASIYCVFGDYDWYTWIKSNELFKLHSCALYSLLGIPQLG